MPSENELNQSLSRVSNWVPVSYKQDLVKKLSKLLRDGEQVGDLLEGFYNGLSVRGTDTGVSGVLFFTSKRLLFIANGKNRPDHEEISRDDILSTKTEKGFATVRLIFNLSGKKIQFDTVSSVSTVETTLFRLTSAMEQLTIEQPQESIQSSSPDILDELSKLNFIFLEAKKIIILFKEFGDFGGDGGFPDKLLKDVVLICSLCFTPGDKVYEESKLFLALLLLPYRAHTGDFEATARDIYTYDSFPLHYKDTLLAFYASRDWISPAVIKGDEKLNSLEILSAYDGKEGTDHLTKMRSAFYAMAQCFVKADGTVTEDEKERLKKIYNLIHAHGNKDAAKAAEEQAETLEDVLAKLNKLIGMEKIKDQIKTFINLVSIQKERKERNLPQTPLSLHAVFYGPPGTGKTTIARIIGKIYKHLGLLKEGKLIETDRAGLVAGYVGQTAKRVDEVVQSAMDGVLFIDEAYTLAPEDAGKDYGQEVIDTLLKRMEDYRERFAVIVAGYPDEMRRFIYSNPGLKSRFSRYFYFDHYTPEELIRIFDIFTREAAFTTSDEARAQLLSAFKELYENRSRTFGNGRVVRNIFEKIIEKQANRLAGISPLTDELLCAITSEDVPTIEELGE